MIGTFVKTSPTLYVAGFLILLASHGFAYFKGYQHEHDKFAGYRAEVSAAQEATRIESERKLAEAERMADVAGRGWKAAADYYRNRADRPIVRVLQPNCDQGTGTKVTFPASGLDAATSVGQLSATAHEAEALIDKGVHGAAQVLHLQAYINRLCNVYGCE